MKKIFTIFSVLAIATVVFAETDYKAMKEIKKIKQGKSSLGSPVIPVLFTVEDSSASRIISTDDYGKIIVVTGATTTNAMVLPANGAPIGSVVDVMNGAGTTDATVITISAATADTLVGPNDQDLDSVTYATTHRIGAHARFISDGAFWHALNIGGTTMTYTD